MSEVTKEIQDTIRQTVRELFKEMGPLMESIALTPEKLREAQKPYEDPLKLARELREQQNWRRQEDEKAANKNQRQSQCAHKDKNGHYRLSIVHNFHDHMPRGICPICEILIYPAHWDFRPELQADGTYKEKGFIVPEHSLYYLVRQQEAFA